MKNRGCVADAFLERFWKALEGQNGARAYENGAPFGDHFPSKNRKMAYESVKGSPNGAKSKKKRHRQIDAKNDAEKK